MRKTRVFKLIANVCRLILACTFILSGFTKVIDPWGTAMKVNEYLSIYGVESLQPASMAFSIWLCGAELMMGCMLLFKVRIRLISIFAVLSMLFFTALTLLSATLIPVEDCGCFGEALKLTPWQTFFKNLALLPMAFVVWWRYRPDKIFAFNALEIVLTVTFFFLSMYLGYYCYRHLPLIDFLPYKVGVNIREAMQAPIVEPGESETVLVYRNRRTGREREFSLEDTEWQDAEKWEWVDTRTTSEVPAVRPLVSEFALRDAEGDATEEVLTMPGRVYMLCVTAFDRLPRSCARRMARLAERAREEGANVVCLTPAPLYGVTGHEFGTVEVQKELAKDIPKVKVKVTAFARITKDMQRGAISQEDARKAKDYVRDLLYDALRDANISVEAFEQRISSERVYQHCGITRTANPRGRPPKEKAGEQS